MSGETADETNQQLVSMETMLQILQQINKPTQNENFSQTIIITEKLTNQNYAKWSRLMYLAISGRGRLNHITDTPPLIIDPEHPKWIQRDSMVFSWIIENIDSELVNQFLDYPTALELWKGIEALYSSGRDGLQIYDLSTRATSLKQGKESIEIFYGKMVSLWKDIDRRMPNPMKCAEDITIFNTITQQNRLYQFLGGINDSLDKKRRDILKMDPLPSVETTYAQIRREIIWRDIMRGESPLKEHQSEIGVGLATKGKPESSRPKRENDDKSHLKCSYCGGSRHTKNGCFKLIGYPEWWPEIKKKGVKTLGRSDGLFNREGKTNISVSEEINQVRTGGQTNITLGEEGKKFHGINRVFMEAEYGKKEKSGTRINKLIGKGLTDNSTFSFKKGVAKHRH